MAFGIKFGKNEILADIILLISSLVISAIAIYVFDIHWSFYPGETIVPPSRRILQEPTLYYIGVPVGGLVGFIILKAISYAFLKEEDDYLDYKKETKNKNSKNAGKKRRVTSS